VLSAVAERATITTLTNIEGKSLTEVTLRVRNHARAFVKVELPIGAQLLSAEVEGERVKPVLDADGSRVPLLRVGLDSSKPYTVSFVYLSSGGRFSKTGNYEMALPKLDIPVNVLSWEVSLPDRLEVRQFGGNAFAAELFPAAAQNVIVDQADFSEKDANVWANTGGEIDNLTAGQVGGIIVDPNGAVVANASVTVVNKQTGASQTTRTNGEGHWIVSGVQPGPVTVTVMSPGFSNFQQEFAIDSSRPARLGTTLQPGSITETVQISSDGVDNERESRKLEEQVHKKQLAQLNAPSANVFSLQRRVAGILPVHVDVPRSGKSYRFVRPLVMEEETTITFQYKSK
jgi:hypothetical protein